MSAKALSQAVLISRQLSTAKTREDVLKICAAYDKLANTVNRVTALSMLAKSPTLPLDDARFTQLLKRLQDALDTEDVSHRDLATLSSSMARHSNTCFDLLWSSLERQNTQWISPRDMAQLIWSMARRPSAIPALLDQCVQEEIDFDEHQVAMVLHGSASAGVRHPALRVYALQAAKARFVGYSARHCASVLWALAKVRADVEGIIDPLAHHVMKLRTCDVVPATNMLWACAKLQRHISFAQYLTGAIMRQGAGAREWSTVLWACATLNMTPPPGMVTAVEAALSVLVPQQICNVMWALAVLGVDDACLDRLAARLGERQAVIAALTPQGVSNILWALGARARLGHPDLVLALVQECSARATQFSAPEISSAAWAMTRLCGLPAGSPQGCDALQQHAFFVAATNHCKDAFLRYNAQSLSALVYAMAKLLYTAPGVLAQIHTLGPAWGTYKSQELSMLAWSFAVCNCAAGVGAMARELSSRAQLAPVDIGQMLWAMSVTKHYEPDVFLPLLRTVARLPMHNVLLLECYTAALGFATEHPAGAEAVLGSIRDAFPRFDEARDVLCAQKPQSSRAHLAVSRLLDQLGVRHENEYATCDGQFLDIAMESRLAVEIHGPMHYLRVVGSEVEMLEGSTLFKERLLQRRGWQVHHISAAAFRRDPDREGASIAAFVQSHL